MPSFSLVQEFADDFSNVKDLHALKEILSAACLAIGCRFFALTHHVDFLEDSSCGIRLHNYPESWTQWFDTRRLGVSDPVHRASHLTARGFCWHEVPTLIRLTQQDREVFEGARLHGIGDGFTVPANVPGEALGSCSFAMEAGKPLPQPAIAFAQWIGLYAFEAARRIEDARPFETASVLTDRQRECAVWVGRGKTDWEIAKIIGVSRETVIDHMRNARGRCNTSNRAGIVVRALFEGSINFSEIFRR